MTAAGLSLTRCVTFAGCGDGMWILRNKANPAQFKLAPDYCHDRFCRPCAASRSATVARNIRELIGDHHARHITLTLKHRPQPLKEQLDRLYAAYRRLRQRRLWKERVTGAAAMLEITWNADTNRWHPHLHVVAIGDFLPLSDLRAAWLAVTGDSHIVDIKLIKDPRTTAAYVAKYATKAIDSELTTHPLPLTEAIRALTGRRAIVSSGSWAHARLTTPPKNDEWTCVCHANELHFCDRIPPSLVPVLATWLQQVRDNLAEPLAILDLPQLPPQQEKPP